MIKIGAACTQRAQQGNGGRVQYDLRVYTPDKPLTPESARQLAAALIDAADEIDRLT